MYNFTTVVVRNIFVKDSFKIKFLNANLLTVGNNLEQYRFNLIVKQFDFDNP